MTNSWRRWRGIFRNPRSPLTSRTRRQGYGNGFYGVADYLVWPIGMLLAAPFLLRHLGTSQYGIWILAGAAVSGGGIVSGSFGDAVIKYVGDCRGRADWRGVTRIVRSMISINVVMSGILAIALWYLAPPMSRQVIKSHFELQASCQQSLRIGSVLLVMKSIESVFISTLRAFETYGSTVRISICSRIAILAVAIVLASSGCTVVSIMVATSFITAAGTLGQALALKSKIGFFSPLPLWHRKTVRDVASFGSFSWLQAIAGLVFSHADRFFVGFLIGAPAVAYYGLCVQAAQPIHGLISSGMHFLFPHLSARYPVAPPSEIRRKVILAFKVNGSLVLVFSAPLIVLGNRFLSLWIGPSFTQQPPLVFFTIAWSFAFLGMNVTAHYALLAAGHVRVVTYLNLLAGILMLLIMTLLIPKYGLLGAAFARLIYGPITCLAYVRLYKMTHRAKPNTEQLRSSIHNAAVTNVE
jgi:O-antigen/teichoic acid export membrane protein